jgi:hypothetical protein
MGAAMFVAPGTGYPGSVAPTVRYPIVAPTVGYPIVAPIPPGARISQVSIIGTTVTNSKVFYCIVTTLADGSVEQTTARYSQFHQLAETLSRDRAFRSVSIRLPGKILFKSTLSVAEIQARQIQLDQWLRCVVSSAVMQSPRASALVRSFLRLQPPVIQQQQPPPAQFAYPPQVPVQYAQPQGMAVTPHAYPPMQQAQQVQHLPMQQAQQVPMQQAQHVPMAEPIYDPNQQAAASGAMLYNSAMQTK